MNPSEPTVAVVMPVGGVDDVLANQVAAVLAQVCSSEFEVVLSVNTADRSSIAQLGSIVSQLDDKRLRVVHSSDQRGAAHARNRGVSATGAQRIAFCDVDDLVHEGWLEALMGGLEQFHAVSGRAIDVFSSPRMARWHPPATPGELPQFLGRHYLITCTMAIRREAFDAVGGFDESLTRCEDIAIGWALGQQGFLLGYVPDSVLDYRHRAGLSLMLHQHYLYGRGMSEVLRKYGVPSSDQWVPTSNPLKSLRPNNQRVARKTFVGYLRRGAIAIGRIHGLLTSRPSKEVFHRARPTTGYLTTHYPAVSHTFIMREIMELRSIGHSIETFAINALRADDVQTETDRVEASHTTVIKAMPKRWMVTTVLRAALGHPGALIGTIRLSWRNVGLDGQRFVRRTMQVGESLLLERSCRERGIDHVHVHFGQAPANIAWFACVYGNARDRRRSMSWSMTIHGPQDCLNEPQSLLEAKVRASSFVVAVADYTSAQLIRMLPLELWGRVHVIRCGIDLGGSQKVDRRGGDPFRVLMVARISPEKGHGVALEALRLLLDRGRSVHLEVVGPGNFELSFGSMIDDLDLRGAVSVSGALPPAGVADRMRESDLFCLPSFAEGLPVVLMEAMAVGLPVVASGISGIPELVRHEITGLLVAPARPDLLADAIQRMIDEPDFRESLATAGRTAVELLHNARTNAVSLSDLFARAAGTDPEFGARVAVEFERALRP